MDEKTYVIVYQHTHKVDRYEEDPDSDYGREFHYLEGETKVETKEVVGFEAMQKQCESIGEANADNPPYDEYHIVVVYEKESHDNVPEHYWYPSQEKVNSFEETFGVCQFCKDDYEEPKKVRLYPIHARLMCGKCASESNGDKKEESE